MIAAAGSYIQNASDTELGLWLARLLEYAAQPLPRLQASNVKALADEILNEIADRKLRKALA